MNIKDKLLKIFNILLVALAFQFDLKATSGEFLPLSCFERGKKQKIIEYYNIGTKLDERIIKIASCETRNILYTQYEEINFVVVSGLYPVVVPGTLYDSRGNAPIKLNCVCLPQILLDEVTFSKLSEYVWNVNTYDVNKRDLLSTTAGKAVQLDEKALEVSSRYHECSKKLFDNFAHYQKAFLVYMDSLKLYVQYICSIRGIEDSDSIKAISSCKSKISQLTQEKVAQIKSVFDDTLTGSVREYAHSETAFLYYCYVIRQRHELPCVLFTTRDMCHVCEETFVNGVKSDVIVVSTKEHDYSWKRHTKGSMVKKVVIDTDVRFNVMFSSLTDKTKRDELISEYYKLYSDRGISLLFQDSSIPRQLSSLFVITEVDFDMAGGNPDKKLRRDQMTSYAMDSKLATLSMLIRMYQCVFSKTYIGTKEDIIKETRTAISSPFFSHMDQGLLLSYMDYMIEKLQQN